MPIDDYITTKDIGNVANALGVVNKINLNEDANRRAEERHERDMSALDLADKTREDRNTALTYMQNDMEIPSALNLDQAAVVSAKTLNAQGRQADDLVNDLDMKKAVQDKENEILANLAQWDGKSTEFFRGVVPETSTDMKALLNVRKGLNENEKLSYENMQQLRLTAKVQYEDHKGKMSVADQYLKAGNTQLAEKSILSAVNDTPHPVYMEKNAQGNYDLYYEEMGQEKEIIPQGQNISLQQAIQLIRSVPPQDAQNILALDMAAAQEFNANVKPVVWTNSGTKDAVEVFQMKNPLNPSEPQILVFEKDGGRLDGITVDSLRQNGYRPEAGLDAKLKQAQINETNAKALKAKNEATGKGPKDYKALSQQLDNYKKSMALVLAPWNKGNEDTENMDFSDSGTGPLKLAMDYYQNNRQAFESGSLKGQELSKYQNAAEAVRLHGMIRQVVGQMHGFEGPAAQTTADINLKPGQAYTVEEIKTAGGKRDKKGNWYVPAGNGKVRKVDVANLRPAAEKQKPSSSDGLVPSHGPATAMGHAEAPKPVGELDGRPVGTSRYGYMIQEGDGSWREPTPEELQQIEIMARKGQIKSSEGWKYKTKYPNSGINAMSVGDFNSLNLTPSNRR